MPFKQFAGLKLILVLIACALAVCACAVQPQPSADLPTALASLTAPAPSQTPTTPSTPTLPSPTATEIPPTATTQPSDTPAPTSTTGPPVVLDGETLVAALQQGGYVIYFRHAETDQSQTDTATANFQDCSTQRNLNEAGRAAAREIGAAFLALDIPVGKVLSSAYCRTRETALLAFGEAEVTTDLTGFPTELGEQRIAALRRMLSQEPVPGTNTVLVSHGFNISNSVGISIVEGEAVVFAPGGADGYRLVARVLPEQWGELAGLLANLGGEGYVDDPSILLPDLVALPPADLLILADAATGHKQLRFTTSIQNNGPGNMEVWGYSDPTSAKTIVVQQIGALEGPQKKVVVGEFIFHADHDHWHLGNFARYEVWALGPEGTLDSRVAVTDKVSYCLRDDSRADPPTQDTQTFTGCNHQKQGITPGWVDIYKFDLPGQNVDISGLPDGTYALLNMVDPDSLLWDRDHENNSAGILITIEGNRVSVVE